MLSKKGWYLTLVMILIAVLYCPFFTIFSYSEELKKEEYKENKLEGELLESYNRMCNAAMSKSSFTKAAVNAPYVEGIDRNIQVCYNVLGSCPTTNTIYSEGDVFPVTIDYGYVVLDSLTTVNYINDENGIIYLNMYRGNADYNQFKFYMNDRTNDGQIYPFNKAQTSLRARGGSVVYDPSNNTYYTVYLNFGNLNGTNTYKYDIGRNKLIALFPPHVYEPESDNNDVSPDDTPINSDATQSNFTQVIDGINNQNTLIHKIGNVLEIILDNLVSGRVTDGSNRTFTFTGYVTGDSITYRGFNVNLNEFSIENENIKITSTEKTASFSMMLSMKFDQIINYFETVLDLLSNWFYPLRNTDPLYWRTYNTNTSQQEDSNIAGVLYDITWYLGNLYVLQSANSTLNGMQDSIDDAKEQFQTVENQEVNIINSVKNKFNDFNPSSSDIGSLTALSWLSNLLQQIYVSLGSFGIAIICGLTLSLCMQFIGYFRYK